MKDEIENQIDEGTIEESTYCVVKVGEKDFLLPVEHVREIVDLNPLYPVPTAPEYIYGVVPIRGRIVPAIDLSKIYPAGKPEYSDAKLVVVDLEVELLRETINENIGFISETLPYFVTFGSDIPADDIIHVKSFFQAFRVKEPHYGTV
ncbi:MAG: chemotaxis protein CheW [Nitrospirae bacterium]|nr:chemotaxis protein CheW [Nitrospirota bacterium]MBI3378099.1 chemotaxis protein CheW [Nitrospirota bacterium]